MKTQASSSMNFFGRKYFVILATFLVTLAYVQCCAGQQKPGWTLILDDEFNETSVDDLFGSTGLWCSLDGCYDPSSPSTYFSPVPAWTNLPKGCQQPAINTSLTIGQTLTLTARKEPGKYTEYRFPKADLFGSIWAFVYATLADVAVGSPVGDELHIVPAGTTVVAFFAPVGGGGVWVKLSNAATGYANGDQLTILTCAPYTYTAAEIYSQRAFLYGYFEARAKIPNRGKYTNSAFWLWGANSPSTYREIDVFEFGDDPTKNDDIIMNEHLSPGIDGGNPGSSHFNNYPASYIYYPPNGSDNLTDAFHTYAVKWTPNSVTWYLDNQPIRLLAGHTPHLDMHLVADVAVGAWNLPPEGDLPENYEIDYIRAYRSQSNEFMWQWGNGGSGWIAGWHADPATDKYLSGDFAGSGRKQLLAIATNVYGWAGLLKYSSGDWSNVWDNQGSGWIAGWHISPSDNYIVGDFAGLGHDQLLAINDNDGWAVLMHDSSGKWYNVWDNGGTGKINWWNMHPGDEYVAGDFDGDGQDELLAISPNGWAHLMKYSGGAWFTIWSNGGSGWISGWHIGPGGKFLSGDFEGEGRKELMAMATNASDWAVLMHYSGGKWYNIWDNGGSGKIHWWYMHPSDQYLVGNFDGGKQDQLLAVATNGWSHLMSYSGPDWDTPWSNDGGGTIDLWYMHPSDRYIPGDFNGEGKADLFAIATNGWAHLMERRLP
jgi:hypothetical protein